MHAFFPVNALCSGVPLIGRMPASNHEVSVQYGYAEFDECQLQETQITKSKEVGYHENSPEYFSLVSD